MSEERIGKYEVLGKIAEGGFGTVYKARDPFIKRIVAIKTCPIHDEEVRHRFFREARIVGGFDHPHVTIVHDFGLEGDRAFLVQEYLPGEDLAEKIRARAPLSLKRKVAYLLQAARGLAYAHSKGVIHRDIKPANLRVLETDQIKVLDFGIAKLTASGTHLTQKGVAVGTIGYLSPEQLKELPLDARTDIFSFGVTAYELLTYRKPFRGSDISSVMRAILEREPDPIPDLVPGVPAALVDVIKKCLEKDRDARYSSFDAVISDLKRIDAELPEDDAVTATAPVAISKTDADEDQSEAVTGEHRTAGVAADEGPASDTREAPSPPKSDGPASTRPAAPAATPSRPAAEPAAAGRPVDGPRQPPPRPQRWRAALGITLLVVLVLGGGLAIAWYFYSGPATEPEPEPELVTQPVAEPEPEPEPTAPGFVVVDAEPWAEIVSVLDESGEETDEVRGRSTPYRIELPPGTYSIVLSAPGLTEPSICQTRVVSGSTTRCAVQIRSVDVSDYFREMGWWR